MDTIILDAPAMYADHHVLEVRRVLLEAPGVDAVDASSALRSVEIHFDPERIEADVLRQRLDEAGYLADPLLPQESGAPVVQGADERPWFRHSTAYQIAGTSVSFEQTVALPARPLWPCPGVPVGSDIDAEDV